mgnify:CR=1 FL=1
MLTEKNETKSVMARESLDFLALNADTPVAKAKVGCKVVHRDRHALRD